MWVFEGVLSSSGGAILGQNLEKVKIKLKVQSFLPT